MSIPNEPPRPFAPLFGLERDRLLEFLQSLGPTDWDRQTPCPGWSVLGLATHLLGGDLGLLARNRDQHFGTEPPEGLDEAGFIGWLDELQASWVATARRISPRIVVELLAWSGPQVSEMIAQQDPTAHTASVCWASREAVPVWLDHCRELSEWWIHRQQLREALGAASDLRSDLAAPVLDGLKWAYPYRLADLDRPLGTTAVVEIANDDRETVWTFSLDASGWRHDDSAGQAAANAQLFMTADQAWRLLTNNLDAVERGQLVTSGDPEIVATLIRTRSIIGSPK